jgi:hypothetical protein
METASAAATVAFLKLILELPVELFGLAVPQWYNVDNPKFAALFRLLNQCCPFAPAGVATENGRDLNSMAIGGYQPVTGADFSAAREKKEDRCGKR